MHNIPLRRGLRPVLLAAALLLSPTVFANEPPPGSINDEIRADMADARREVQAELAVARAELDTGNLELGQNLRFGRSDRSSDKSDPLPKAEITLAGDFLIEGKTVAIDARQRRELLVYREQVIDIARAGIDIGERSANAALDAVDQGLFRLMFSAMTGSLERRMEKTIRQTVEPGVRQICQRLPDLYDSQQRLGDALPQFRPYATLRADDIDDCMQQVHQEFARN
ncbi:MULTISPECIES: hypothetical protein [unclassified Luteimonas]